MFIRQSEALAYAAGLMDGEGSIQINKDKCPTSRTGYKYQLVVSMCSIRPEFLQWLKEHFGGSFFISGRTSVGNQVYHWELSAKKAGKFLECVFPYLLTKKEKARVALEFQASIERKEHHPGAKGYTKEQWEELARQKELIRSTR